ncbi:hypothetical protein P3T76_012175 [Phytophthora citrophthora]|uniref:Uncharacterized protein n=1 Tax=Phytophthora citrophthora TaxID=4793 RepID=A0AAD9G679_9STRA|nr:hypothetical protein P3T76_012175 [Phytophthora citrophthora]
MTDVAAAVVEQDADGWNEVEQTLTSLELPPVPPTSDPQRLLGYVLHILPRYTEMEMLATHLRLYASTLEQDMEQVKTHVRLLTREAAGEREKKQFLERYAAQVVKERNDLLHSRGSSKKKAPSSHFVWHNCCKKNTNHAIDLAPSILAFRGEKLQESLKQIDILQEEVHNQEILRKELDFMLKKAQREHDSKVAADRKHILQLEKQILQRSTLHSSLERKLYEVESVLARHDKTKEEELTVVSNHLREAQSRVANLEKENTNLQVQTTRLSSDRDRLVELLEVTTESKDVFGEQIDKLTEKCQSLESEVEALRSEIDMLQTKDINDIRTQYTAKIDRLQKDNAASEQKLRQEVDRVKRALKNRDESLVQAFSVRQSSAEGSSRRPPSGRTNGLESVPLSDGEPGWSDSMFDDDRPFEGDEMGSSLSRSQLSVSRKSIDLASSEASHFNLLKEVGALSNSDLARSSQGYESRQTYADSSRHGYSRELDAVSRALSTSSKELESRSQENDADFSTANEPFDWETFIDSTSDISTVHDGHRRRSISAVPRSLDLSTSTIHCESSVVRVSDPGFEDDTKACALSFEEEQKREEEAGSHETNDRSFDKSRSHVELDDEEEKEVDLDDTMTKEQQDEDVIIDSNSTEHGQQQDYEESVTEGGHAQNDFARDMHEILNGLEQKRKEEEQKASLAEQALLEFQQLQHGMQTSQLPPESGFHDKGN